MDKNLILIEYLKQVANGNSNNQELENAVENYIFKSEYSTNDNDLKVIVVSQRPIEKEVLFDGTKLYDGFQIEVFGDSIRNEKEVANAIGNLIGDNVQVTYDKKTYHILFSQVSNPQSIFYDDIRRVGYSMILRTIISEI